jgi:protein-S-isoprenylcysteine O-methyltransferase Ste14
MTRASKLLASSMLVLANVCGGASLILFAVFLGGRWPQIVRLRWPDGAALLLDGLLSLAFFLQHSGMVRRRLRSRMANVVPPLYHGALYSVVSGLALTLLVVVWQPTGTHLLNLQGPLRWAAHGCSLLAIAGFAWGLYALRSFDFFGLAPIRARLRGRPAPRPAFVVRGPYRWVRHPLYLCVLVLIWARPDLTADRLLFDVLFTIWICVGAALEEADLVADFGDAYRDYRRKVPMLIPWRCPAAP